MKYGGTPEDKKWRVATSDLRDWVYTLKTDNQNYELLSLNYKTKNETPNF